MADFGSHHPHASPEWQITTAPTEYPIPSQLLRALHHVCISFQPHPLGQICKSLNTDQGRKTEQNTQRAQAKGQRVWADNKLQSSDSVGIAPTTLFCAWLVVALLFWCLRLGLFVVLTCLQLSDVNQASLYFIDIRLANFFSRLGHSSFPFLHRPQWWQDTPESHHITQLWLSLWLQIFLLRLMLKWKHRIAEHWQNPGWPPKNWYVLVGKHCWPWSTRCWSSGFVSLLLFVCLLVYKEYYPAVYTDLDLTV